MKSSIPKGEIESTMGGYTESHYEHSLIELFTETLGYEHVYGPDIERDFHSPLYHTVLEDSLYRLNAGLPQEAIQEALSELIKNKTVIIIAHRMRTIRSADKIVLLNKGRIEAAGTDSELLKSSEMYQAMLKKSMA